MARKHPEGAVRTVEGRLAALEEAVANLIRERGDRPSRASNLRERAKELWDQADELRRCADRLLEERREVLEVMNRINDPPLTPKMDGVRR